MKLENFDPTPNDEMRKDSKLGTKAYRDGLAKELKGVKDHEDRRKIHEKIKDDPKYHAAREEKMSSNLEIKDLTYQNLGNAHYYTAEVNGKNVALRIGFGDTIEEFVIDNRSVTESEKAIRLADKIVREANFVDSSVKDFDKAMTDFSDDIENEKFNNWFDDLDV